MVATHKRRCQQFNTTTGKGKGDLFESQTDYSSIVHVLSLLLTV